MTITEYSKVIDQTKLSYEGNDISTTCKEFLQGLLEKNYNKRMSFDQAMNHPWITLIRDKIDDVTSRFQSDPDKMIVELNKTHLTDDYFKDKHYVDLEYSREDNKTEDFSNKKRKRSRRE